MEESFEKIKHNIVTFKDQSIVVDIPYVFIR